MDCTEGLRAPPVLTPAVVCLLAGAGSGASCVYVCRALMIMRSRKRASSRSSTGLQASRRRRPTPCAAWYSSSRRSSSSSRRSRRSWSLLRLHQPPARRTSPSPKGCRLETSFRQRLVVCWSSWPCQVCTVCTYCWLCFFSTLECLRLLACVAVRCCVLRACVPLTRNSFPCAEGCGPGSLLAIPVPQAAPPVEAPAPEAAQAGGVQP